MTVQKESLSLHWGAIFAGVFVALLSYFALMSLGLAVGASVLKETFQTSDTYNGLAVGAGVWTVASILFSLFVGSYAAGRVSGAIATRIGFTQGAVITALFFGLMMLQIGSSVGNFTRTVTNFSSSGVGTYVGGVTRNSRLTNVIQDGLGSTNTKIPARAFVYGMSQRLMRGDTESARDFMQAQTGMPRAEAQARVTAMTERYRATLADIGDKTTVAASRVGWAAFVAIFLGAISAMLGGGTGAMVNLRKPLDQVDERAMRRVPAFP